LRKKICLIHANFPDVGVRFRWIEMYSRLGLVITQTNLVRKALFLLFTIYVD